LRHSSEWVARRLASMLAVDDAYLWHDVLGGRAIHQNSFSHPPTKPWRGNFHTQQQAFFADVKMDLYELGGRRDERLLDDAGELLTWVLKNGYDRQQRQFYFVYNRRTKKWNRTFYSQFNMMSVCAMLRYATYRNQPDMRDAAETVLSRIRECGAFDPRARKSIYESSYLALKFLDAYETTRRKDLLRDAATIMTLADRALWDDEYGGWFDNRIPGGALPRHTTKFTHTNANMTQAALRLSLLGAATDTPLRDHALRTLEFLNQHSRSPDGGWYRHNTRDGGDPTRPPGIGDGGTTEGGNVCVYDRMAQMIVACALAYQAAGQVRYLRWVDETLDKMEKTHLTRYPAGVNYGYTRADDYENTWCHLWGLKAMIALRKLWETAPGKEPRK